MNDEADGRTYHRINQYVIVEEIGRGSFGAVHRATDQFGNEFVSLAGCHLLHLPVALSLLPVTSHLSPVCRLVSCMLCLVYKLDAPRLTSTYTQNTIMQVLTHRKGRQGILKSPSEEKSSVQYPASRPSCLVTSSPPPPTKTRPWGSPFAATNRSARRRAKRRLVPDPGGNRHYEEAQSPKFGAAY